MLLHLLPLSCPRRPAAALRPGSGGGGGGPWARRAGGLARRRAVRRTDLQPETPRRGDDGHDPHAGGALLETVRRLLLAKEEADAEGEEEEEQAQFPKRWAIVFLCFSAFLLCNMDRVRVPECLCSLTPYSATTSLLPAHRLLGLHDRSATNDQAGQIASSRIQS